MMQGRHHDKKILVCSRVRFREAAEAIVDSGYQGLQKDHLKTSLPTKKSKNHPLTKDQKRANRTQSRRRILVENVIGSVKRFRILGDRYRNRRKRFGLRFNLIAAIYNMELANAA
jgi:hypothetical protein